MVSRTTLFSILAVLVLAAGCAEQDGGGGTTTTPTTGGGDGQQRYLVGTDAAFPPFEEVAADGTFSGFDIDVMNEVARRNGWTIEFRNLAFDTLIPSLQNNQIQFAISAMSINENRSRVVDFSIPYYEANQSVAQLVADVEQYGSLEDMRGKTITWGAQSGTVAVDIIEGEGEDGWTLKRYDTYPLALQAMKTGEVDVVMMDAPAQREAQKSDPLIKVAFEFSTGDIYGIALPKGSNLLGDVNDALEAMQDDGTLAQLRTKWGV